MREMPNARLSTRFHRAALAIAVGGIVAATSVHASVLNRDIVVPPSDLPELARQSGESMILRDSGDGTTRLYVELEQGARLAIFDVSDPARIRSEGSVALNASGPFDFVYALDRNTELVRFRQGQEEAVVDFHKAKRPVLMSEQAAQISGPGAAQVGVPALRDYRVTTVNSQGLPQGTLIVQVRQEISNAATGTTFLLAKDGLFLVRRPLAETINQLETNSPYRIDD
jgi:hypothetical protein